jgi:hypothetical protein
MSRKMAPDIDKMLPVQCRFLLNNILNEGELAQNRVVKEYLTTAADGKNGCCKYYHTMEALVLRGRP